MINIYGTINALGYGIHANNMIKAFSDANVDINLTTIGQIQSDSYFEEYWKKAQENRINYEMNSPSLFIFHDELSNQANGSPLFVFSIFETTQPKSESIAMLKNGPASHILVTTQKHKELLELQNIGKPIYVVNEGVDDTIYNTIPVDKYIDTSKFTYLTVGKKEERKKTNLIIKSFIDLMSDKEVALIAHTFNPFANKENVHPFKNLMSWSDINPIDYGFEYKGWDGKAHRFTKNKCDIILTAPGLPTTLMSTLYHSANVGIQISRGEGWDLPLMEMMACGLPCIATDCLGHSEYLKPSTEDPLIISLDKKEIADDGIWFKGNVGEWSVVNEDCFKQKLLYTWENREKYEEKSEDLADYTAETFAWSKAVDQFNKLLA